MDGNSSKEIVLKKNGPEVHFWRFVGNTALDIYICSIYIYVGWGDKIYLLFQMLSFEYTSYIDNAPIDECKTKVFLEFFQFFHFEM